MHAEKSNNPNAGTRRDGRPLRVLIVDDSKIDREIIVHHIRQAWPFEHDLVCETAEDGTEALAKLSGESFTMVLLEWRALELRGADILRKLRADGLEIPVVVLSGLDREEINEDLESFRASYLSKEHLNPATLQNAVLVSAQCSMIRQGRSAGGGTFEL
jgi:CheY-like chemotaxis protein